MDKTIKCLLMGFYNRNNIGDDTYQTVIPFLLPSCEIQCISCDDATFIDNDIDVVLIGGGDLVNDYFMNKIQQLLRSYTGRVYGVSLGIPFQGFSHHLHLFDHLIVRSMADYKLACQEIGDKNVSFLPDFSVALPRLIAQPIIQKKQLNTLNIGVCLAQPLFYNNPKKSLLLDNLCNALIKFAKDATRQIKYIFVAFNSNTSNNQECDYIINTQMAKKLSKQNIDVNIRHDISTPIQMLSFFQEELDMCLCARYHSVMFSVIAGKPFVPLYVSQKIHNILEDIQYPKEFACRMPYDSKCRPTQIDVIELYNALSNMSMYVNNENEVPYQRLDYQNQVQKISEQLYDIVVVKQPYASIISRIKVSNFTDVLNRCKLALCKYLDIEPHNFQDVLHRVGELTVISSNKKPLDIARFLCFNITGQMHHACVWGLADNLQKPNFKLYDALKYIYDEVDISNKKRGLSYYPTIYNLNRRTLINVDFVFSNDFTKYHRSGWSYVVGGLMNLDATTMLKQSDVFIDTYVDRSFHWGKDIMKTLGEIPYTRSWYGFIHHTFDTTHSINNCQTLLEQEDFLLSLNTCKGLIALTQYLKNKLEIALYEKGVTHVPVHVLYHPMEFVENNFTPSKFINNTDKKIVQIGAWLRNPYAIYQMTLPNKKEFDIKKTHLKGTEMDLYFAPNNFFDIITQSLCLHDKNYLSSLSSFSSPSSSLPSMCRAESISRQDNTYPSNKYCQGVLHLLEFNHNSVTVLDKLSNQEYDKLLAENIVFLNLVDCSAVNTVIECIVRDTPLVVNRHPALEELLGIDYPGFYDTLQEAGELCVSMSSILKMYNHMRTLDKKRYMLENFIADFQAIIVDGSNSSNYAIQQVVNKQNIFPVRFYKDINRFLPARYRVPTHLV